jgi:hypothetical protein
MRASPAANAGALIVARAAVRNLDRCPFLFVYTSLDPLQLVSDLHLAMADLPRRQLQHAMRFQVDAGSPERGQALPKPEHAKIFAERDHIDRKQHAKRMDSGRRPDEKPASGVKSSPAHQPNQAGERCVGYRNPRADRGGPRYVSEAQWRTPITVHPAMPSRAFCDI